VESKEQQNEDKPVKKKNKKEKKKVEGNAEELLLDEVQSKTEEI